MKEMIDEYNKCFIDVYDKYRDYIEDVFIEARERVLKGRQDDLINSHSNNHELIQRSLNPISERDKALEYRRENNLFTEIPNQINLYNEALKNYLLSSDEREYNRAVSKIRVRLDNLTDHILSPGELLSNIKNIRDDIKQREAFERRRGKKGGSPGDVMRKALDHYAESFMYFYHPPYHKIIQLQQEGADNIKLKNFMNNYKVNYDNFIHFFSSIIPDGIDKKQFINLTKIPQVQRGLINKEHNTQKTQKNMIAIKERIATAKAKIEEKKTAKETNLLKILGKGTALNKPGNSKITEKKTAKETDLLKILGKGTPLNQVKKKPPPRKKHKPRTSTRRTNVSL